MNSGYRHFLIPLDGSRLAEAVLAPTLAIAARFSARVTLLHVLERNPPETVHGEPHLTGMREAERYLENVVRQFQTAGVSAGCHAHPNPEGDVAAAIAAHAAELDADLIAIATHGSGGLRRLLAGSIAQQTLRHGLTDVLLVHPQTTRNVPPFSCDEVVLALDPAEHGATAFDRALAVALACRARLRLLTAIPPPNLTQPQRRAALALSPRAAAAELAFEREDAESWLAGLAKTAREAGLDSRTEIRRGDPLAEVAAALGDGRGTLLVLATHARAGLAGVLAGSFAPRLVARIRLPVLLVRMPPTGHAVTGSEGGAD